MSGSRQLAAIMFTDIQGYTSLMQQSEPAARELRQRHREIFESETAKFKGKIINYFGDGTLSIFESAVSAVKCGHALQLRFRSKPAIPVRIGIHMGDIMVTEVDVIGDSVNIASRIESIGVPGSVLISGKVYEEIKNHDELLVKSAGFFSFKNDSKEREVFALDLPNLVVPETGTLAGKTEQRSELPKKNKGKQFKIIRNIMLAIVFLSVLTMIFWSVWSKKSNENWARKEAPLQIQELIDLGQNWEAFRIWEKAINLSDEDPNLLKFEALLSYSLSLTTEPEKVSIYRKPFDADDHTYELIGITPFNQKRVFSGQTAWMLVSPGYDTLYKLGRARGLFNDHLIMPKIGEIPQDMVKVDHFEFSVMIPGIDHLEAEPVNQFLVDRFEVTNVDFKNFVDNGGYTNPEYWKYPLEKGNQVLSFEEAMDLFKDATNRSGPSTWELGDFPDGTAQYPVTGISWFEAAAYAAFVDKQLPTIYHWNTIATTWYSELIVPLSNLAGTGLAPVGLFKGLSSNGIYDIAGNAREWCLNSSNRNSERFIMGGAWSDASYAFTDAGTEDPWNRSPLNGFRCIQYITENENQENLEKRVDFYFRDFLNEPIASDVEFQLIKRQFDYDNTPLNAAIKKIDVSSEDWEVEEISFDAAYGNEIMMAYLYLPKNSKPPYQTVIYFTGSGALFRDKFNPDSEFQLRYLDFIIKSGRAVLFPIYQSTYHRDDEVTSDYPNETNYYKERFIMWGKDLRRSLDYLATREDIDMERVAYFGYSWGASNAGMMGAIEDRLKCLILKCGGLYHQPAQREVDLINYLPRVTQPVLMLNGIHDMFYPLQSSQIPLFELLGTDPSMKQHKLYDVNHVIPRNVLVTEVLSWLDTYLGEVNE